MKKILELGAVFRFVEFFRGLISPRVSIVDKRRWSLVQKTKDVQRVKRTDEPHEAWKLLEMDPTRGGVGSEPPAS